MRNEERTAGAVGFPARLRSLRTKKRLSQQVVADFCMMSRNTLARYETGERTPTITAAATLADFFGVSLDYLAGRLVKS